MATTAGGALAAAWESVEPGERPPAAKLGQSLGGGFHRTLLAELDTCWAEVGVRPTNAVRSAAQALWRGAVGEAGPGWGAERTARDFRTALGEHAGSFAEVVFGISDWSPERRYLGPFRDVLARALDGGGREGRSG